MSCGTEGQASRHKRHDRLTVGHGVYAAWVSRCSQLTLAEDGLANCSAGLGILILFALSGRER